MCRCDVEFRGLLKLNLKDLTYHLFQLTLSAQVFLDVHPLQSFSTEEHSAQPSGGQSVASIHPHVLLKANDTLSNP